MSCLLFAATSYAQASGLVTLTVSADGPTKMDAVKNALRSAIEQTYGAFVSANTSILNDNLVKDEIVTISTGNINSYEELSSMSMPDGRWFVSLRATVSVSKLVSYAQSKGAETEFAGATFGMNMKMKELNKQSEKVALDNMLSQIKAMLPFSYDIGISVEDPIATSTYDFLQMLMGVSYLSNPEQELKSYVRGKACYQGKEKRQESHQYTYTHSILDPEVYERLKNWICSADSCYLVNLSVQFTPNKNAVKLFDLIYETISSISLGNDEAKEYEKLHLKTTTMGPFWLPDFYKEYKETRGSLVPIPFRWESKLRNSPKDIRDWLIKLGNTFYDCFSNFKIIDNTNQESCLNFVLRHRNTDLEDFSDSDLDGKWGEVWWSSLGYIVTGERLFSPFAIIKYNNKMGFDLYDYSAGSGSLEFCGGDQMNVNIRFLMPISDISKYSNFKVEKK